MKIYPPIISKKFKQNMFLIISLTTWVNLLSCTSSSHRQKFNKYLQGNDCDQALLMVPENQDQYKITSVTKQAGETLISYSLSGAAYATQIVWDVTVGVTSVVILCAPFYALAMASNSSSLAGVDAQKLCVPADINPLMAPKLGKNTYEQTETLRCPDVTGLSQSIRKVAKCYNQKGGVEAQKKAIQTLESVTQSGRFYNCLPNDEINGFTKELTDYRQQLVTETQKSNVKPLLSN